MKFKEIFRKTTLEDDMIEFMFKHKEIQGMRIELKKEATKK